MGKPMPPKPSPGAYRDVNIDYPDSDLPAYEDVPTVPTSSRRTPAQLQEPQSYLIHPSLPTSQISRDEITITTHWPLYSQDAKFLTAMLKDQAKYPPTFTARIVGTHSETTRKKDKQEKVTVTDFDIRLDMTHLLVPGPDTPHSLLYQDLVTPIPQIKAYRGHRTQSVCPQESAPDFDSYIQSYTSSPFPVRSFTLNRRIMYHDSAALEALFTSLVGSTNYRGQLKVTFPITHNRVTVYSPCWQNHHREKMWLRWIFYLTFLWILSWPYLWFMTRRWEVVTAVFPYSTDPENGNRQFVTKSEEAFYKEWRSSIRRAVVGKRQGWIDEEYKLATEELQGGQKGVSRMLSTGDATTDGALGSLRQAVSAGRDVAMAGGWGADSW